jgi:hypothetical protein
MLSTYASEIWSFILGALGGGAAGSLITFKYTRTTKSSGSGNASDQSGVSAGGDVVGRDKITGSPTKSR